MQGSFAEHAAAVQSLGHEVRFLRGPEETEGLEACILPGGESTTLLQLMAKTGLDQWLKGAAAGGMPIYGTCAGMIVLARLGLLDIEVERNAYGPQLFSFEMEIDFQGQAFPGVFIRAPKIIKTGAGVETLASNGQTPVLVRRKNVLAGSFHPELTGDLRIHEFFLDSF